MIGTDTNVAAPPVDGFPHDFRRDVATAAYQIQARSPRTVVEPSQHRGHQPIGAPDTGVEVSCSPKVYHCRHGRRC